MKPVQQPPTVPRKLPVNPWIEESARVIVKFEFLGAASLEVKCGRKWGHWPGFAPTHRTHPKLSGWQADGRRSGGSGFIGRDT